jgi:two-component SAPR family response regulator
MKKKLSTEVTLCMKYIIADPDIQNGIDLKKILDGYEIPDFQGSFTTLSATENYCLEHPPDMAFIRLEKAELNAFRLAGKVKELNPFSRVIFVGSQKESAVEAFEYEADGFLLVPFDKKKIGQLLNQVSERKNIKVGLLKDYRGK